MKIACNSGTLGKSHVIASASVQQLGIVALGDMQNQAFIVLSSADMGDF